MASPNGGVVTRVSPEAFAVKREKGITAMQDCKVAPFAINHVVALRFRAAQIRLESAAFCAMLRTMSACERKQMLT
jgi:hypothetical protein